MAIAHEIGHMLLPDGKHAKSGFMAAPWNPSHFRSAAAGLLLFSEASAELIRRELERADTLTYGGSCAAREMTEQSDLGMRFFVDLLESCG